MSIKSKSTVYTHINGGQTAARRHALVALRAEMQFLKLIASCSLVVDVCFIYQFVYTSWYGSFPRCLRDFHYQKCKSKAQVKLLIFPKWNQNFSKRLIVKTFRHFPSLRMRTNAFSEEATADHYLEEHKNTLQDYWRSFKLDLKAQKSKAMLRILCISIQC